MRAAIVVIFALAVALSLPMESSYAQDRTASVTGRVYYQGIQPESPHLGGVVLVPIETTQPISVQTLADEFGAVLDDEDRFAFAGLAAGRYLLGSFGADNPDYFPLLDTFITVREDRGGGLERIPAVEISLRAGEQLVFDIPIVLPDFAATPQPTYIPRYSGSISGRITATGPAPNGQFIIALYPADAPQPIDPDDHNSGTFIIRRDRFVIVELDGDSTDYTITDLVDGEYFLIPPVRPLLIARESELVEVRYTLPPEAQDFSPEQVRSLISNPDIRSYYDSLSDEEINEQIRDGLTYPVRVLRVNVTNGAATTGVDFTLEYPEVQPVSLGPSELPSSGTAVDPDDGGWSAAYVAAALAGLTAVAIAALAAVRLRMLKRDD